MSTITLRSVKGSGLTNNEIDANFTNLNTDKIEATQTVTLTNKTLALGGNTISGTTAQFNTALTDGDFATLAGTETLTNKTLTAPVINGFTGTGNASITGTLSVTNTSTLASINASGVVTLSSTNGIPLRLSGATTGNTIISCTNTGGDAYFGQENSAGNNIIVGSTGYDTVIRGPSGIAFSANAGNTMHMRISSTGLAVTGALSATGAISGTTAGVRLPTNSPVYFNAGYNTYIQELSAGNLQVVAGGTSIGNFTATGLAVTGALSATSRISATSDQTVPTDGSAYFYKSSTGGVLSGYQVVLETGSAGSRTTKATLDNNGNLGLGVTPSAWGTGTAIEMGNRHAWTKYGYLLNGYFDGSNYRYRDSAAAGLYSISGNTHSWYTAPSGTAGNAITFTQAMTLDASGNLGLGVTPSATGGAARSLDVGSVATFTSNPAGNTATSLTQNAYTDGTNWIYRNSSTGAALYQMTGANAGSTHVWSCSTGGTAGNTITFTQVLAVEKDKTLALQGATSAAGCGIAFPATQVASSNANTLDDYEEGTWTPSLTFGNTSVGMAGTFSGTYTKVGRSVSIRGSVMLTAKGSSTGPAEIQGLPFTAPVYAPVTAYLSAVAYTGSPNFLIDGTTTKVALQQVTEAGAAGYLSEGNFIDTSIVFIACTYFV